MSIFITWDEDEKLIIRDIHAKWHDRVLHFMVEHHYRPHPLYTHLKWQDDPDVEKDYIAYLKHLLLGECCIVVLPNEEESTDILAVAILKWMTREWRSWTMLQSVPNSPQWSELLKVQMKMLKTHAQAKELRAGGPQTPFHAIRPCDSLHLFWYYACDALRDNPDFMDRFFFAICEVARHMYMPCVTFAAFSMLEQRHASEAGFVEVDRVLYSLYLNKQGYRPFSILRDLDEMHVALYEHPVGTIVPFREMSGFEELEERMRIAALKGIKI